MPGYILKRILFFIPTLLLISLLAFVISTYAPGDPVAAVSCDWQSTQPTQSYEACEARKKEVRDTFRLNLPLFYFRFRSLSEPDTLYRLYDPQTRTAMSRLLTQYGDWPSIHTWYQLLKNLRKAYATHLKQGANRDFVQNQQTSKALAISLRLLRDFRHEDIDRNLRGLTDIHGEAPHLQTVEPLLSSIEEQFEEIRRRSAGWQQYVPAISWYGFNNQYHHWLLNLLTWDLGKSYLDPFPSITSRIGDHFFWSFVLTLLSVVLAYLVAIPLGVLAARYQNQAFDRWSGFFVLAMDSLPAFFVATLLMVFFVEVFDWQQVSFGIIPEPGESQWDVFWKHLGRLVVPLIAYTYGALAFLSKTVRSSMLEVLQQDFIRTAHAKGLSQWQVLLKHGLRNALLPIITLFAGVFPALISGSVILERIFVIPGMGREALRAIELQDTPMIVAIFTLTGCLTVIGYLVADILYAVADPRIQLEKH